MNSNNGKSLENWIWDAACSIRSVKDAAIPWSLAGLLDRLEALKRDRAGQHSIRINDQWRICFRWSDGHAYDVEIVDYHS